jgi:hypothetical protein
MPPIVSTIPGEFESSGIEATHRDLPHGATDGIEDAQGQFRLPVKTETDRGLGIERIGIIRQKRKTIGQDLLPANDSFCAGTGSLRFGEGFERRVDNLAHDVRIEGLIGDVTHDSIMVYDDVAGAAEAVKPSYLAGTQEQAICGSGAPGKALLQLTGRAIPHVEPEGNERLALEFLMNSFNVRRRRTTIRSVVAEEVQQHDLAFELAQGYCGAVQLLQFEIRGGITDLDRC